MTKTVTDYKIGEDGRIFKGEEFMAHVVGEDDSALHCIWVLEGKKEHHFYTHDGGVVYLNVPVEFYF